MRLTGCWLQRLATRSSAKQVEQRASGLLVPACCVHQTENRRMASANAENDGGDPGTSMLDRIDAVPDFWRLSSFSLPYRRCWRPSSPKADQVKREQKGRCHVEHEPGSDAEDRGRTAFGWRSACARPASSAKPFRASLSAFRGLRGCLRPSVRMSRVSLLRTSASMTSRSAGVGLRRKACGLPFAHARGRCCRRWRRIRHSSSWRRPSTSPPFWFAGF